jgi:hypothetical protein
VGETAADERLDGDRRDAARRRHSRGDHPWRADLAEEAETPIGFYMASQAEEAIRYTGPEAGAPSV